MDRIVFYSEGLEQEFVQHILPAVTIDTVYSRRRLVESLVDEPYLVGAIIDIARLSPDWTTFLNAVAASFSVLPVMVALQEDHQGCPEQFLCVNRNGSDTEVSEALKKHFGNIEKRNRRRYHRFSWPLTARVVGGDGTVHRVTEISAGGAYLEPSSSAVGAGDTCELEIEFRNFRMTTTCTILDPRRVGSHYGPGFGVRFDTISDPARDFVNRVVSDALIQTLTNPESSAAVPSIETEEDVLAIGDEFSLA